MAFLTKDAIKGNKSTPKMKKVEIPEWGGHVFVRELTAHGRDRFEDVMFAFNTETGKVEMRQGQQRRTFFLVLTVCDENGDAVFTDEDISWLSEMEFSVIDRIYQEAQKINGMTVEKATKNSESPSGGNSSSD